MTSLSSSQIFLQNLEEYIEHFFQHKKFEAACKNVRLLPDGNNPFYSKEAQIQNKVIAEYCFNCPIKKECLEVALFYQDNQGIWGGVTSSTRKAMLTLIRKDFQDFTHFTWTEEYWTRVQEYINLFYSSSFIPFSKKKGLVDKGRKNHMYQKLRVRNAFSETPS